MHLGRASSRVLTLDAPATLQDIYDEFVTRATAHARSAMGDPLDANTELGPQVVPQPVDAANGIHVRSLTCVMMHGRLLKQCDVRDVPQASEAALKKTLGYIDGAIKDGATLQTGELQEATPLVSGCCASQVGSIAHRVLQ
jgi:acyl-CoA reductase-like NAD-dependent aldehyde dehydrogenase